MWKNFIVEARLGFNTSLILSSNVIWHVYRLISETKIFRLGGSLVCLLYVKEEYRLTKKHNTERYIRTFRHIYDKWSILIIQYKSTLNLHLLYMNIWLYMNIYEYILLFNSSCFLFIATLSQLMRTMVTLVSHSYDLFQLVLLVGTACTIVNMIQVINKEDRVT